MRKRQTIPGWREFEKLVARIEQDSRPLDWIVRSPDKIRSKITGRMREVDASVQRPIKGQKELIVIECRKRSSRQDVTWIEQLATKKTSLGADRLLAVCSTGFSDEAKRVAEHFRIELRTVNELSVENLTELFGIDFVLFPHKRCHILRIVCRRFISLDWTIPKGCDFEFDLLPSTDMHEHIFANIETGYTWSVNDMWLQLQSLTNPFQDVPRSGRSIERSVCFPYPGNVTVETSNGKELLGDVLFKLEMWFEIEHVSQDMAKKAEYVSEDGNSLQRIEFASKEPGYEDWRFSMQAPTTSTNRKDLRVKYEMPREDA